MRPFDLKKYIPFFLPAVLLFLSSCSGGSGGGIGPDSTADPIGALTSQMEAIVEGAETPEFTTDLGYVVTLQNATITLSDITVSGGGAGEEEEDEHTHCVAAVNPVDVYGDRHEESSPSAETGAFLQGEWTVNPFSGDVTLGVAQANPGTYDTLSLFIAPSEADLPSVVIEGVATLNGVDYPFAADLPIDESVQVDGLAITFEYGHYLPVHIGFHIAHWLNGVDFSSLASEDGTIYINGEEHVDAFEIIREHVLGHVHVETGAE